MTNRKTTRRALFMSVISLMLCCAMLVGTTFAWFTDEVTSVNNIIKAGNLDVELYYKNGANSSYAAVGSDPLFSSSLWEPGHVEMVNLKVSNLGTLALKYQLNVSVINEKGGINKAGEDFLLSDYIRYAVLDGDNYATREAAVAAAGQGIAVNGLNWTESGTLYPKADAAAKQEKEAYVTLVVWMPETVTNEANYKTGTEAPQITLGINLYATQVENENDSFGNDYDAGIVLIEVTNADELKTALEKGGNIKLGADITVPQDESITVPKGVTAVLNMNGKTITGNGNITGAFGAVSTYGNLKIENGTFTATGTAGKTHHCVYIGSGGHAVINGGTFAHNGAGTSDSGATITIYDYTDNDVCDATLTINGGTFTGSGTYIKSFDKYDNESEFVITGGTFSNDPTKYVASGYEVKDNGNGTWTVSRIVVEIPESNVTDDKVANGNTLASAIDSAADNAVLNLPAGEYKMPSVSGDKEFTITGTKDTVIDLTMGAYMDSSKVSFEGVTIKGSTGKANGNGSDYAALYTPNVTYTNCTFDGPFRIGRDGATFINCTFTNLGNDYVWTYGNDATFEGCTFNTDGKAILVYSDGGSEVSQVSVKNCVFNSTQGAKAGAIANQNCAAIEIHNYGNGVNLTTSGNTYDSNFSGEWRIKTYEAGKPKIFVNGTEYTTIAIDGKTMTIDADKNVTVKP